MPPDGLLTVALVLIGFLLVANHAWLFPAGADVEYTYERSEIDVENDRLVYEGKPTGSGEAAANDLNAVGCQFEDGGERACAFDHHLREEGPVSVSEADLPPAWVRHDGPDYVSLDDGYYHRVHRDTGSSTTYDVEPVAPEDLLVAISDDLSDLRADDPELDGDSSRSVELRVAHTGDVTTTGRELGDDHLGNVYRHDDAYYTIVVADETARDRPRVHWSHRAALTVVGSFLLVVSGTLPSAHRRWT